MNRIFLLMVAALLLTACGVESIPQEGIANAVVYNEGVAAVFVNNEEPEVTADRVWADIRPLAGTNRATVIFRVEMSEDALKMGGEGPFYLYGGGLMQVEDANFIFDDQAPIQGQGSGQMRLFRLDIDEAALSVAGHTHVALTAQIDGLKAAQTDVIMLGSVHTGREETAVLVDNEGIYELADFQCEGRMIPDSNMAGMTYTAKMEDGQVMIGAGIGLLHDMTAANSDTTFECNMDDKGGAAYLATIEGVEGAKFVDLVIEGLKARTDNGQTLTIDMVNVYGFHMGDGSSSLNFNIGMPPT